MQDISSLLIGGFPLIAVIFGLVEFVKVFGVKGRVLTFVSLLIGVILGVTYKLTLAVPVDWVGWLSVVIFGLVLGLTTSGIYDFMDARLKYYKSGP